LGLSDADFAAWGWRIPFLLSAVLVGLGLWVRLKIGETPDFAEAMEKDAPVAVPLGELFRHHLVPRLRGPLRSSPVSRSSISRRASRSRTERRRLAIRKSSSC
jgi:MFS family permease